MIPITEFDWTQVPRYQYKQQVNRIINEINNNENNQDNWAKTHINTVLERINKSQDEIPCVLIFTDGRLLKEDIDTAKFNYKEYIITIQAAIQELDLRKIPAFIVQSSPSAGTVFNNTQNMIVPDSLSTYMDDDLFWINSAKTISEDDLEQFDFFIGRVIDEIITLSQPSLDLEDDKLVKAMVYLNYILAHKDSIYKELNLSKYLPEDKIQKIDSLSDSFKKSSITYKETQVIKHQIDELKEYITELKKIIIDYYKGLAPQEKDLNNLMVNLEATKPLEIPDINRSDYLDYEQAIIRGLSDYIIKRSKEEAIYFLFEDMNQKSLLSSTYVRDTLFRNTFNFLSGLESQPDLLLIKEAFNKDIDDFHSNLLKYPKVYESEALIAIVYSAKLIENLINTGQLEKAFVNLKNIRGEGNYNSYVEKGILITSFLIESIEKNDLTELYLSINSIDLDFLSKELITYFSETYPDFNRLEIGEVNDHVENIYRTYLSIKSQIKQIQNIPSPNSDFIEYQKYRNEIVLNITKRSTDLMISGIELVYLFKKDNQNKREILQAVTEARNYASSAIDSWFYIKKKEYVKAVMILLPAISRIIQTNPDLSELVALNFNQIKDSLKNNALRNLNVNFEENEMKSLAKRIDPIYLKDLIDSLNKKNVKDSVYRQALTSRNYSELTNLITYDGGFAVVDTTHITEAVKFLEDFKKNGSHRNRDKKFKNLDFENYTFPAEFGLYFIDFPELDKNFTNLVKIGAELSTVENANDITNVLTKYALPKASYRLKRDKKWSIMINAYAGIGGSYYTDTDQFKAVISAPLGLEFSKSLNRKRNSASLLLVPIDLGNVLNYQIIGDPDQDQNDVFRFENIYSPSVFFVYGFSRKAPFSAGIGHQWNVNRLTLFISFDLPIFRLY